ncbi:MAG: gluconate 2-dehydrogenase subunit 3 family protein [Burkholderiaceae bacterium]|nr:gluconate 2-dehydrogenase subunit 3 family protein [Burkholderiaceae bacterium]
MTDAASAPSADTPLTTAQSAILDLVLDLILPPSAERRLPGAAELGVPAYLAAQAPEALPLIARELDALEARARDQHAQGFATLPAAQRQALVDSLRAQDASFMSRLALETVTCYYQHDRVLEALGMETRAPYPQGFQVIAGDLALLAPVRRRGKVYRDA